MKQILHDVINKVAIIKYQVDKQTRDKDGSWDKVGSNIDKILSIIKDSQKSNQLGCVLQSEATEFALAWTQSIQILFDVKVEFAMEEGKPPLNPNDYVYNDNPKMDAVFTNAVENAIKGGATTFKLTAHRTEYYTEYALYDNGRGMTEEQINALGLGFTRGGHGEGTKFMRQMLSDIGGYAVWESKIGIGTVFRARVPNGPSAARKAA